MKFPLTPAGIEVFNFVKANPLELIFFLFYFIISVAGTAVLIGDIGNYRFLGINIILNFVLTVGILCWILKLKKEVLLGKRAVKFLYVIHPYLCDYEKNPGKYFRSYEHEDTYFNFDKLCSWRETDVAGLIILGMQEGTEDVENSHLQHEFIEYLKNCSTDWTFHKRCTKFRKFYDVDAIFLNLVDKNYNDLIGKLRWNVLMAFSTGNFEKDKVLKNLDGYRQENKVCFEIATRVVNRYFTQSKKPD